MIDWYEDVGELIANFNTKWFPLMLQAALQKVFQYDYFLLVIYENSKSMRVVHSDFRDVKINQALQYLQNENYIANAMFRLFSANRLIPGIYEMQYLQNEARKLPPVDISNLPNIEHCEKEEMGCRTLGWPKFLQETCIVGATADTYCAAISLYNRGVAGTKINNIENLHTIFPVVSSLLGAYLTSPFGKKWRNDQNFPSTLATGGERLNVENFFQTCYNVALTPREVDIFDRLLDGRTVAEIARELCVSIHTAKTHRRNVYNKVGYGNQLEFMKQFNLFKVKQ
ncbi:MAG: helix-turn-helix transcriptional regulator [Robiginitomaculum sp.]